MDVDMYSFWYDTRCVNNVITSVPPAVVRSIIVSAYKSTVVSRWTVKRLNRYDNKAVQLTVAGLWNDPSLSQSLIVKWIRIWAVCTSAVAGANWFSVYAHGGILTAVPASTKVHDLSIYGWQNAPKIPEFGFNHGCKEYFHRLSDLSTAWDAPICMQLFLTVLCKLSKLTGRAHWGLFITNVLHEVSTKYMWQSRNNLQTWIVSFYLHEMNGGEMSSAARLTACVECTKAATG
jgi:hypothetical protein